MFKKVLTACTFLFYSLSFNANADIVIIGHPDLETGNIDTSSIRNLFLGNRSAFPNGMPAVPLNHVKGSPGRDQFFSSVLSMSEKTHKRHWKRMQASRVVYQPEEVSSYEELIEEVSTTPGSIAYISGDKVPASVKVLMRYSTPESVDFDGVEIVSIK